MTMTDRPIVPVDYPALAEKLGLRGSCVVTVPTAGAEPQRIPRPATCTDGALTIALTETVGPWRDSSPQPILTLTHRASGLALDVVPPAGGRWWPATAAGLQLARRTMKALRTATEGTVDWLAVDPFPADETRGLVVAAVRAALLAQLTAAAEGAKKKA